MDKTDIETIAKTIVVEDLDNLQLLFQAKLGFQFSYDRKYTTMICGALATNRNIAVEKAKSEFWERFCAVYQGENLFNERDLKTHKRVSSIHYRYWVPGKSFNDVRRVFIPAHAVFIKFVGEKIKSVLSNDGSGLASHKSLDKAKIHGLLEVIERDQICLFWDVKNSTAYRFIGWQNEISQKIVTFLRRRHYEVDILYLDEFRDLGIFTFIALLTNPNGNITVGSVSSLKVKDGVERAILETITLQETVVLQPKINRKVVVGNTSLSHVLYAYQNSKKIREYIQSKIIETMPYSRITDGQKKFNYKVLEKRLGCEFYYYKFPNSSKNRITVRVIAKTAYRKTNVWPIKKQNNNRLTAYLKKFNSPLNKTIPHPYG